ncbi:MAG: outer membrane beta-barrel family protein [Bacteroidota bacterium]|nr:outer membrane beta-barrel family protein [Bacteroidota bacterium]
MNNFKLTLIFLITLFFIGNANAQRQRPDRENMPKKSISGSVFDKSTKNPLEYATVSLFSLRDSSLVSGAIADEKGLYAIKEIMPGKYYLVANFIGYKKHQTENIFVNPRKSDIVAEPIFLAPASQNLEGVDIVAEHERIEYNIDKKIINVSKDLNASGGTAIDVLENTPSVEVDIDGNVSLRGSSNFKVYVDGKPSVLDGSDLLQQIPSSSIKQIEIITNPSAKYDPDGTAGIINIVMKEKREKGLNGVVNASIGTGDKYGSDFLLNYRTGKLNVFGGIDYRKRTMEGEGKIYRKKFSNDSIFFVNSDKTRDRYRDGYSFQAGVDYTFNPKHSISISGKKGNYGFGMDFDSKIHSYSNPETIDEYSLNSNIMDRSGDYYSTTLNYLWKLNNNGHEIAVMAYYQNNDNKNSETMDDYITDADFYITNNSTPSLIKTYENEDSEEFRFKIDYTLPINEESRFEAGLQARNKEESSDYKYTTFSYDDITWVNNPIYSNQFAYHRNIFSGYSTYSNSFSIFDYKVGLRAEYTDREISKETGESYVIDHVDWFPSFHTSTNIDDKHSLQASYSRRVHRPRGWYLDPKVSFRDKYNVRQGNPGLKPEYTDSYEVSLMKRLPKGFLSLEGYYRKTENKITRLSTSYTNEIMMMTFENLDNDKALGMELMVNTSLTKWLKVNLMGNYYNYQVNQEINGENISNESNTWSTRINGNFKITPTTRLQLSSFYRGPSITITGDRDAMFFSSMAIRKDFLNKHLNVTLNVRDIFSTMKHQITTDQPTYYIEQEMTRKGPIVMLNISYMINDYKKKQNNRNEDSSSEIDSEF